MCVPTFFKALQEHAINAYGFTQHESPELQAALNQKGDPQVWIILTPTDYRILAPKTT